MTTKSEFNGEEWERVARGPVLAGVMVALADRGGSFRESLALGKAYAAAKREEGGTELLNELVASPPSLDRESAGQPDQIPEQIREAVRIVDEKATPEEAEEYRQFILRLADVVAHAHKEGGVLGIGGKEVSEEEQAALDRLSSTVEPGSGPALDAP
jgi:hypothetical protein